MKKLSLSFLLLALVAMLSAFPAAAQTTIVKGTVIDQQGQPMVGAQVEFKNTEAGQTYKLKTDKKGQFFSLGVVGGPYKVTLSKDGKELTHYNNVRITLTKEENEVNFDLQKMMAEQAATAQGQQPVPGAAPATPQEPTGKLTPEQQKQLEQYRQQQQAAQKEAQAVKGLNEMLAQARAAAQAGNNDQAITVMQQATQVDPNRDLIWAVLGQYQIEAAKKAPDAATKNSRYAESAQSYQKAVDLCTANPASTSCKDPLTLAGYYNNLGQALGHTGKLNESTAAYDKAVQLNPQGAAMYYYNQGATLTNAGRADDANAAFDKCIAADANHADCYFQKGVNYLSKATIKDGKMVAPPEAEQNLQKYLQLAPEGPFAANAKELLASLGTSVQTTYGTPRKKK